MNTTTCRWNRSKDAESNVVHEAAEKRMHGIGRAGENALPCIEENERLSFVEMDGKARRRSSFLKGCLSLRDTISRSFPLHLGKDGIR